MPQDTAVDRPGGTQAIGGGSAGEYRTGMYVRVPVDVEETEIAGAFRDLRLGQVVEVRPATKSLQVQLLIPHDEHRLRRVMAEGALAYVRRGAIAPGAHFIHRDTKAWGRVLIACEMDFAPGEMRRYYAEIGDQVKILAEDEMYVAFNEQDPDCVCQLADYEFHPPIWRFHRDRLVESYALLQTATFGIEELVGARIMLLAHQAEAVARVLGDRVCRFVLADEVGLGKTIEACVILKGLRHRQPKLKALVIVPGTLLRQWHNELNDKFWLDFAVLDRAPTASQEVPGVMLSHDALRDNGLWQWVAAQRWDLLIVDEAHNLRRHKQIYDRVHELSRQTERALVLSATPIERRAAEYLALLRIMHPAHYDSMTSASFQEMLRLQAPIRDKVSYLTRALKPDEFDAREFHEEIAPIVEALADDPVLPGLVEAVSAELPDHGLAAGREALLYVSENYRVESRVIRNRRISLLDSGQVELPRRKVSTQFTYTPGAYESEALLALHSYADACLQQTKGQEALGFCQALFHAAFSSPAALLALLDARKNGQGPLATLAHSFPAFKGESELGERLVWQSRRWQAETDRVLETLVQRSALPNLPHRLVQVLRALQVALAQPHSKVLVFSAWGPTLDVLYERLRRIYGKSSIAQFRSGLSPDTLQAEVDHYQADEGCRILLTDESGGEGRNFQMADQIVHVDLPWTPVQLEQRIGRVDRLGRQGEVLSVAPVALGTLEEDLFNLWHRAFRIFERSLSGLEFVLEKAQDDVIGALAHDTVNGLADLLPHMVENARKLRKEVEDERYFEEAGINSRRRAEFDEVAGKYRDGELLRGSVLGWAGTAGLSHDYDPRRKIAVFDPHRFSLKSIENAKFARPPDMQEALRRSGRTHNLVLQGTFDRDLAVLREDIIFLAPGEPWTDAILTNALEADRGRCSGILRLAPELPVDWLGIELLYRIQVDPRPLYAAGFHPAHLFRAGGYLAQPWLRLLVSSTGEIAERSGPVGRIVARPFDKERDGQLGKRGGVDSLLKSFLSAYPQPGWNNIIQCVTEAANRYLLAHMDRFTEAAEAETDFARAAAGQRAAHRWLRREGDAGRVAEIEEYEEASRALLQGISRPLWKLESACVWYLKAGGRHAL